MNACPFCASIDLAVWENEDFWWIVACKHCGCVGPDAKEKEEAIRLWNMRPPIDQTTQPAKG